MSQHAFQAEVQQLLHLMIHSLYSEREIFLRELISNAADACDKLRFEALANPEAIQQPSELKIQVSVDKEKREIRVKDNGIGMSRAEVIDNIGTIARSGTREFLNQLTGDQQKDALLIGQFGVGFYSSFTVADQVTLETRRADVAAEAGVRWSSDGTGSYTLEECERAEPGTEVILHLKEDADEFLESFRLRHIITRYSDHVAFAIQIPKTGDEGKPTAEWETINRASALWTRAKSEISDEEYREFYKHVAHDFDDPTAWIHSHVEGRQQYTTLLYIPKRAPFDLWDRDRRHGVKLYVKRVFITDDDKELMPTYLRFVRGIIDSEDLPLNVSREILQQNRVMAKIRESSVKKILGEFARVAQEDPEKWLEFIEQYNRPLKEGLYSDFGNREQLLALVRFKSTKAEGWTSLAEYKERMLPDQKSIYYITGDNEETLRRSPLLEAYRNKDIEVLIMAQDVDELVIPMIGTYKETELKSVNRSDAGEDLKSEKDQKKDDELKPVIERMKKVLGENVKDVVTSVRLADSPSCIVVDESDPTMQMAQMMKAMGQKDLPEVKPILEINPDHAIVTRMKALEDDERFADAAFLLLDQALLVEGAPVKEPAEFVKRLNRVMETAL